MVPPSILIFPFDWTIPTEGPPPAYPNPALSMSCFLCDWPHRFLFIVTFLFLSAHASAQTYGGNAEQHKEWIGTHNYSKLGQSVSGAGDMNGDGLDDILVGMIGADTPLLFDCGAVFAYSGADGSLLYVWEGTSTNELMGSAVSGAGDVNGDGFDDILIGSKNASPAGISEAGSAFLYSGIDGTLLHQWDGGAINDHYGSSVSGVGDINGDGFDDVLVGATGFDPLGINNGVVFIFSGIDGTVIRRLDGPVSGTLFGHTVSGAGDFDGDGRPDIIIGDHFADPGNTGSAYLYSGANGVVLYQWNGVANGDYFGYSVSGAGDVNGDGFDDVIVGAPNENNQAITAGAAYIYSGADGTRLRKGTGEWSWAQYGHSVSGAGDVNGDGFADVIIGAYGSFSFDGAAYLHSGGDGTLLYRWYSEGQTPTYDLGWSVSDAGDVNGDGFADVVIGDPQYWDGNVVWAGSARVYGFDAYMSLSNYEVSAASGGTIFTALQFPDAAAGYEYKVLMSANGTGPIQYGVYIPLTLDFWTLLSFSGNYPWSSFTNLHGTLDASGNGVGSFTILPLNPALIGRQMHFAAVAHQIGVFPEYSSVVNVMTVEP